MGDFSIPPNIEEFAGSTDNERWIRRFIEYDIMDPAWFEIVRRHPEIQVDSDGKKVELQRNHNLKKYVHFQRTEPSESLVSCILHDNNNIVTVSIDNNLVVRNRSTLKILGSLQLRSEADKLPVPLGIPSSQLLSGTFYCVKACHQFSSSPKSSDCNDLNEESADHLLYHRARLVLLTSDLYVENLGADAAPKKGKDKNATVDVKSRTFMRYRVTIIDIHDDEESAIVENVFDWYLNGEFQPEFDTFDTVKALCDRVNCSLGGNGRILSLLVRDHDSSVLNLFDLPITKPPCYRSEFISNKSQPCGTPPTMVSQCKIDNILRDVNVITLPDGDDSNSTASLSEEEKSLTFYENNILILLNVVDSSFLPLLRLVRKPVDIPANTKAAKPAKGAPEVAPPPTSLCIPKEVLRLRLTSAPSVIAHAVLRESEKELKSPTTASKVLLAVGHVDGSITLWNLLDNICVSTLGQHQTLTKLIREKSGMASKTLVPAIITTLKIIPSSSFSIQSSTTAVPSNTIMIIAGAVDGTLSFYSSTGTSFDDIRVSTPKFVDFRQDLYEDPVLDINILRSSGSPAGLCFLVHYASGRRLLYKIYRGRYLLLIAQLSLEERVDFQEMKSSFICVANLPRDPFIPPHDLLNPPPPAEPVAPAKGGGKGKDAPIPEPEPEPTEEELALKAAAEAQKIADDYRTMMSGIKTSNHSMSRCVEKLHSGLSLESLVGIGSVSADGNYTVSLSRNGAAAIGTFSLISYVTHAMESDEFIHEFIQSLNQFNTNDSAIFEASVIAPEPSRTSAKGLSKVRSSLPLNSANTNSLATLNAGSTVSYKQVRLTEQRLHAYEQQFEDTRKGFFDLNSRSMLDDLSIEEEEAMNIPHGPGLADPLLAAKGEILRMKKDKLKARTGAFSKKLTTLASLCT